MITIAIATFFYSAFLMFCLYFLIRKIHQDQADNQLYIPAIIALFFNPFWAGILGAMAGYYFAICLYSASKNKTDTIHQYQALILLVTAFLISMVFEVVNIATSKELDNQALETSNLSLNNVVFLNHLSQRIVSSMLGVESANQTTISISKDF